MKRRAFDASDDVSPDDAATAAPVPRTEPSPHGRTAIALIVLSWLSPLGVVVSVFAGTDHEPSVVWAHRVLAMGALGLLLAGLGLAVRAIDVARKDARVRRRLAVAALLLGLLTPAVWLSEMLLAVRVVVVRERLADAPAETTE